MNAVVWFKDPTQTGANANNITVPMTAIMTEGSKKFVWAVNNESMIISKRGIVVEGVGVKLKVTNGLKVGEIIVAAGVSQLSEGTKVRSWSN